MILRVAIALLLLAPHLIMAQTPGMAVPAALTVLTSGPGGCGGERELTPFATRFFPAVRFTRATCILEHGDSASAIVGLDADSVLYLLASPKAFAFLVARHPPAGLDSVTVLLYAYTVLELSGELVGSHPVTGVADVPEAARPTVAREVPTFARVEPMPEGRGWHVVVVTRSSGGYYRPSVSQNELYVGPQGQVWSMRATKLWRDPDHA